MTLKSLWRRHCIRIQTKKPRSCFITHLFITMSVPAQSHLVKFAQPVSEEQAVWFPPEGAVGRQEAPNCRLVPLSPGAGYLPVPSRAGTQRRDGRDLSELHRRHLPLSLSEAEQPRLNKPSANMCVFGKTLKKQQLWLLGRTAQTAGTHTCQ